jgi:hypothetical protein
MEIQLTARLTCHGRTSLHVEVDAEPDWRLAVSDGLGMGVTVVEGVNAFDGVKVEDGEAGGVTMDEAVVGIVEVVELEGVVEEVRVGVGVASVGVTVGVIMGDTVAILGSSRASIALPLGKATALEGAKVAARTNAILMNLEYMMIG